MNNRLGKYLTYILRHKPDHLDLSLSKDGWLNIESIIEKVKQKEKFELKMSKILEEVKNDKKQRFQISNDGKNIRCLQGHSKGLVDIDFKEENPPEILYHGTKSNIRNSLALEGLQPKNRDFVHLSEDLEVAIQNAERWNTKDIDLYIINTKEMIKDGVKFFKSENNVWLVKEVLPAYLNNVECRKNNIFKEKNKFALK